MDRRAEREAKLARALRENLRRRKAPPPEAAAAEPAPDAPDPGDPPSEEPNGA